MEISLGILIGTIIGLVILSAFFSGSETSLTSASKARIHTLAKSGQKNAIIFEKIFKDKERLIGTILLANNLVNVLASSIATTILLEFFKTDGIAYTTIIMTFMILLFGELLPKTVALSKADVISLKIAPIYKVLITIFYPITGFLNIMVKFLIKLFRIEIKNTQAQVLENENDEKLRGAIDLHSDDSSTSDEKAMLKSILDLEEITVSSIMIPRKNIFSLPANIEIDEMVIKVRNSPHSRIPIWNKNPENIIGVLHVRRLFGEQFNDKEKLSIEDFCHKPWFIPESTTLAIQLMEFKKRREHFSIVVDEYGEFLGIVTLEDILEEIVGDINDENDDKKIPKIKGIKRHLKDSFMVRGTVTIRDINRELNWDLPDKDISTIAGLILYESRTIPNIGQIYSFYGYRFEIINKRNNQIISLKISKIKKKLN